MSLVCTNEQSVDPAMIALRLERLVQSRTGNRIRDLRVEVQDDQVTLTGRASSYHAKQLATHATLDEIGSRSLQNAIDVC